MRLILHISDLHFGRISPDLVEPLIALANGCAPHLVVISGDHTQRARNGQFASAAALFARIKAPVLVVPGNHDIPLGDLLARIFAPWRRYRRHIGTNLEPVYEDDEVIVAGINTVNRWVWQQGRLGHPALTRVEERFANARGRTCIAVMHHPLETRAEWGKAPTRLTRNAVGRLARAGTAIVLAGHIHRAHVAPAEAAPGILTILAGTGLSSRLRGEDNSVHLLALTQEGVGITTFAAGANNHFRAVAHQLFRRRPAGWERAAEAGPDATAEMETAPPVDGAAT